ncbi:putative amidoligase [Lophiotrema nucula]|uniref:Putative amidoligase n=1 Tax=Lophiotrema nucula TaxID=690887 RepID=A0A6A5YFG8_9PLEO|nr:putative amidoligase [Lophiotrema nucula]
MERTSVTVGVELELFVRVLTDRSGEVHNWDGLDEDGRNEQVRRWMKEHLEQSGITANVEDEPPIGTSYDAWSIGVDSSVQLVKTSGNYEFYGIELRSPKFSTSEYHDKIMKLYNVLRKAFEIDVDASCGTHVHTRREDGWNDVDLFRISKGVIRYEDDVTKMYPARENNTYAQRNSLVFDKGKGLEGILAHINSFEGKENARKLLVNAISPDNYRAWNFGHLTGEKGECGTIEFRLPPGSGTAELCLKAIDFTVECVTQKFQ